MRWRTLAGVAILCAVVAVVSSVATTLVLGRAPTAAAPAGGSGGAAGDGDFTAVLHEVSSGVVKVATTACGQHGAGSGFLVGPDLVVTAAHVISGAHTIALTAGSADPVVATVVGRDAARDVALLRAVRPFGSAAHVFGFAAAPSAVGTPVAALGYPLDLPLSASQGWIAGLDRPLDVGPSRTLTGLIQLGAELSDGDSGGPVLGRDGRVVGMVAANAAYATGTAYAVPAGTAGPLVASWQRSTATVPVASVCADAVGSSDRAGVMVEDRSGSAQGPQVVALLKAHVDDINDRDLQAAWDLHTLRARADPPDGYRSFAAGARSSYIQNVVLVSIAPLPAGGLTAEVTFTTLQDASLGPDHEPCSQWDLTYTLLPDAGALRIDRAADVGDSPTSC